MNTNEFRTTLATFANYFGAIAQVSGSLVGLVFVALTFNNKLLGSDGHPGLRALAQQVFADFLMMLVLSLFLLLPSLSLLNLGMVLTSSAVNRVSL